MKNIILFILTMLATRALAQQTGNRTTTAPSLSNPGAVAGIQAAATGQQEGKSSAGGRLAARPASVQILAGSQGLGADVRYGILPRLSGRAGFAIIPVTVDNVFGFGSFATTDQLSARFSNIHLLADYSPFRSSRFRLVGGAAYLLQGHADMLITPNSNYQFGNATVNSSQVGVLNATVSWRGVAPYLGVSLFRAFPNRLFNTNVDIGTYYLASPGTSLSGTKMLSDNSSQEPQFNKNMQEYRFLPVLQLNFNFRIK